jgi:stage II sporulation protein M
LELETVYWEVNLRLITRLEDFKRELIRLLKRDWRFFLWTSWLLIFGIAIGLSQPENSTFIQFITNSVMNKFEKLKDWYTGVPLLGKITIIWGNNIFASVFSIFSGIFLVFPPITNLFENGVVIGIFQKMIGVKAGMTPFWFYLSLAPHGVFELPAFIMASALGIRFGIIPWRMLPNYLGGRQNQPLFKEFFDDLRYYAILLLLMLLVAAVLEVTVSPLMLKMVGAKVLSI